MVRAQMATAAPCATARSIWVSVLRRSSSLIALSCTFLHSYREIPHSSWRFPARGLLLAGTPHPGRPKKCRVRNLFDQWLKLAGGVCIEIGHPTTNTLPTRMISKNRDPVAKRKKNSSLPSGYYSPPPWGSCNRRRLLFAAGLGHPKGRRRPPDRRSAVRRGSLTSPFPRPKVCCSARVSGTRRVAAVSPTEGLRFSSVLRPPPSILISALPPNWLRSRIPATQSSPSSF